MRRLIKIIIFLGAAFLVSYVCFKFIGGLTKGFKDLVIDDKMYVASNDLTASLYDMNYNEAEKLTRGTEVVIKIPTK